MLNILLLLLSFLHFWYKVSETWDMQLPFCASIFVFVKWKGRIQWSRVDLFFLFCSSSPHTTINMPLISHLPKVFFGAYSKKVLNQAAWVYLCHWLSSKSWLLQACSHDFLGCSNWPEWEGGRFWHQPGPKWINLIWLWAGLWVVGEQ